MVKNKPSQTLLYQIKSKLQPSITQKSLLLLLQTTLQVNSSLELTWNHHSHWEKVDKWLLQVGTSGNMWNSMQTVMDLLWIYQTSVMFSKQLLTMNWSLNIKQSFLRQPSVLTTMQPWQLMKSQHLKLIQLSGTIMSWNSGYLVIQLWQFRKSGLVTKNLTVKISLFNCMLTAKL